MKYIKNFNDFINESTAEKPDDKSKQSSELIYEAIKNIYKEACLHEEDENPTHVLDSYVKECFIMMAEMCTRVLKENSDISRNIAKAAMKKSSEKNDDENVVYEKTHTYLNEMMKNIKESYTEKMEEMMQENPAISLIAAKALSKDFTANPDANNY